MIEWFVVAFDFPVTLKVGDNNDSHTIYWYLVLFFDKFLFIYIPID